MKIAFDARMVHGNFSGVGHYSLNLLLALTQIDRQNEYMVITRSGFNYRLPQNFRTFEYDIYPLSVRTLYFLNKKLTDFKPDIFHSTFFTSPLNLGCNTLVTAHDVALLSPNYFHGRNWAVQFYARQFVKFSLNRSFRRSSRIISVSQNVKDDIVKLKLSPESRVRVIHPSINLPLRNTELRDLHPAIESSEKPVILTVGNTRPPKNWWGLVKSFKLYVDQTGKGTLILVSSDDRNLDSIASLIRELSLESGRVKMLGYRSQEELVRLYRSADLFVFPSLYEGFGLPPLEAMACGLPVVASNRGAIPEVLGQAALYVNPEDEGNIARGMQEALENIELRRSLINEGHKQVEKYSWEASARQILELYDELSRG